MKFYETPVIETVRINSDDIYTTVSGVLDEPGYVEQPYDPD